MRFRNPACVAPTPEMDLPCGTEMRALGERHPSFGPNWRPGHWVFLCPRCGAIRAISDQDTQHYAERIR